MKITQKYYILINGHFLYKLFIYKGKIKGVYCSENAENAATFHKSVLKIIIPKITFNTNRIEILSSDTLKQLYK